MFQLSHTLKGHIGAVYSIAVDNDYVYSSAVDRFVVRWHLISGQQDNFVIKLDQPSYAIHTNKSSNYIYVACVDGTIHVIDKYSRKLEFSVNLGKFKIFCLKEIVSNNLLMVVNERGLCFNIDINKQQIRHQQNIIKAKVRRFLVQEDEIIIPDSNGYIHFLESRSLQLKTTIHVAEDSFSSILINSQSSQIILGSKNAQFYFFDLNTHEISHKIPAHNFVVYDLVNLKNYGVSCSRDKTIKIWKNSFTEVIQRIDLKQQGHRYSVNQICQINESSFASCSDDGTIKIFKTDLD